MKITFDKEADAMLIIWNESDDYVDSDMIGDGFLLRMDKAGNPMGIEILYVSDHVTHPEKVNYQAITHPKAD